MFCPSPPLMVGEQPSRPAGTLTAVTAEQANQTLVTGNVSGVTCQLATNNANMGSGSVYLAGFSLNPDNVAGMVGQTAVLQLKYNSVTFWEKTVRFTGSIISELVQFTLPFHDANFVALQSSASTTFAGGCTNTLIAIRGATAYHAVSSLAVVDNRNDPLFGVIRNNAGSYFYASFGGIWGAP